MEAISSPGDVFGGILTGVDENDNNTTIAPSSLHQPTTKPDLGMTSFDTAMEDLSAMDPTSYEILFTTSLVDNSFKDFLSFTGASDSSNSSVEQHTHTSFGVDAPVAAHGSSTASRPPSSFTYISDGSTRSSTTDLFTHSEHPTPSGLQSLSLSALPFSSSASSPPCISDCYRCLSQQLAGLNNCMNDEVGPSVDTILQLERNMQSLSQRLLHCPTCLDNPSSLLLLSIIVDQVVRLLERSFIEKVDSSTFASDHPHPGGRGGVSGRRHTVVGGNSTMSGPLYSHRRPSLVSGMRTGNQDSNTQSQHMQPPMQTTDLRIGDYEVLDEDFKLAFLKRLVRHRLRILAGILTDLQQTTSGQMNDAQCNATHQMVMGVVKRVERLRGKMALKW